jgi:hypothetical protein
VYKDICKNSRREGQRDELLKEIMFQDFPQFDER